MVLLVSHFFVYTVYDLNTYVLCSGAGWKTVNTKQAGFTAKFHKVQLQGQLQEYSCTCVQGYSKQLARLGFGPTTFSQTKPAHVHTGNTHGVAI